MRCLMNTVALATIFNLGATTLPSVAYAQQADTSDLRELIDVQQTETDLALMPEQEWLDDAALDELVAPVALYPDALLAQVLVAATYPLQIVQADRLLAQIEEYLRSGAWAKFRKHAKYQAHQRRRSDSYRNA